MPGVIDDEPLRFGRFEIRPAERLLRVDGQDVSVGARAFDVVLVLAQRRERLVTKQELLDLIWPDVVVEEHNIATHVSSLRKVLGSNVIVTVPGRGYRFVAPPENGARRGVDGTEPSPLPAPTKGASAGLQTHLPGALTPLLGRDEDLAALAALVQRHRLVTVVGAGGIGKSLLVQHLLTRSSSDYAHGVCWVELASVSDPAAVPPRIAEALGVRPAGADPQAGLCSAVAPLTMLVALDNAEHLLADVGRIVAALVDAAPGLRLIVTTQAPLRLAAEHVYRVGPLAVPQGALPAALAQSFGAVALFAERARGADARFVLSDASAPAAIELCRQLDGLPLAIELAAVRAPLLGVRQLAASMQDRLQLLTRNRDAAAPARQQTLRSALEWSCSFLDERERAVFRRLGAMADSAALPFVQQVVADEQGPLDAWAVLDALGTLVDRSLVAVLIGDEGEPRYRLLESPRVLAIEQLRAAGEEEALRRRHAIALAAIFDAAWDDRWSGRVGAQQWANRILRDASDARDAIAWARAASESDTAVAIAATLFRARSLQAERIKLAELCESLADQVASPRLRLRALQTAVHPMYHPQQRRSLELAADAVALARELDREAPDRWPLYFAISLWIRAAAIVSDSSPRELHDALAELSSLEDPGWPAQRLTRGLEAMHMALVALGTPDQATERLLIARRVIAGLEAEGTDTAPNLGSLIDAELACGNAQTAVDVGKRALARMGGSRDEFIRSLVRVNMVLALLVLGDLDAARPLLKTAWTAALQQKVHRYCADSPALLAALESRPRTAARLVGYADAAYAAASTIRQPNEAAARERTGALARAALGDATFDRLVAEGRKLRDEQVAELAFANEDST